MTARTRYIPTSPPNVSYENRELRDILKWLNGELQGISVAISGLEYQDPVTYKEPERIFVGMRAYADGVAWNPTGAGEGLYIYKSTGWSFLG